MNFSVEHTKGDEFYMFVFRFFFKKIHKQKFNIFNMDI